MAGEITITGVCSGGGSPGGNNKELQYNNAGIFGGCAQLFWDSANNRLGLGDSTPAKQLSLTKCMELLTTTTSAIGVIYKGANAWLHDFHHPTGGGAIPTGQNIFLGQGAGNFTTGSTATTTSMASYNLVLGFNALHGVTTGYSNVAQGPNALRHLTTGNNNCAIGNGALYYSLTSNRNMAMGYQAGRGVIGGSFHNNVLIGSKAGRSLADGGNNNICIGYQAGDNITFGEKNIIIGYDLDALSAPSDYQLSIGNVIFGNLGATKRIGINTSTMNETLNVGGAIRLGTSALTNAGTIRWTGADFEGYTGAAWASLTSGSGLWTDAGTYYRPNNWADFKIYDSGRLDLAVSKWVYDDNPIDYVGIGCGQHHWYNQLIKNFAMNDAHDQVIMRVEGKTTGSHDVLALMTAIEMTSGTGQGWALNPLIEIEAAWAPTSNSWAVGCEIDLNNHSSDVHGFTQGLMIVGISTVAPTVAMSISMGTTDWKDGIWMYDISDNGMWFRSNPAPARGIRFDYACSACDILHANNGKVNWKDTGGTERVGSQLDSSNDWHLANNGRYVTLGMGSTDNNPIHIRINGINTCQLIRSPDTDSAGKHYVTLS